MMIMIWVGASSLYIYDFQKWKTRLAFNLVMLEEDDNFIWIMIYIYDCHL